MGRSQDLPLLAGHQVGHRLRASPAQIRPKLPRRGSRHGDQWQGRTARAQRLPLTLSVDIQNQGDPRQTAAQAMQEAHRRGIEVFHMIKKQYASALLGGGRQSYPYAVLRQTGDIDLRVGAREGPRHVAKAGGGVGNP